MRDVQATWECFEALAERFEALGLTDTGLYDLYSEASLGKAYLKTMNIGRWRDLEPSSAELIGQILSAYSVAARRFTSVVKSFRSFIATFCRCIRPFAR